MLRFTYIEQDHAVGLINFNAFSSYAIQDARHVKQQVSLIPCCFVHADR